jgi:rRNA-processing protein FCF1
MVFVTQNIPTRQVGLTHLPNIYMKKTIWKQPTITEKVKKQFEKLKERREKRLNDNVSNSLLRKNMEVYEMGHDVKQLQSMRHINPMLVAHRY